MKKVLICLILAASVGISFDAFAITSVQQKCIDDCKRTFPGIDADSCRQKCNA